jgi:hypothetical protein
MGNNIIEAFEMVFDRTLALQRELGKYESGNDEVSHLKKDLKASDGRLNEAMAASAKLEKSLLAISLAARDVVNCKEGALLDLKAVLEKHGLEIPF